jgi:hypothetical protein
MKNRNGATVAEIPCSLDKIPCSRKKIPCSVEQGICSQAIDAARVLDARIALGGPFFKKFPAKFPASREFEGEDRFDPGCIHHHAVMCYWRFPEGVRKAPNWRGSVRMTTEGRLRRVQLFLGRDRQTSGLGNRDEIAKVPQLHRCLPCLQGMTFSLQSLFLRR